MGVVRFKIGDKVRVVNGPNHGETFTITDVDIWGVHKRYKDVKKWFLEHELELADDPLVKKIEERNNKPVKMISDENLLNDNDPIKPSHYKTGDKDLFDELYDRLYHSKKMFTGREVFIIVMKFVAERYTRRYPNKNAEDLSKGIYTLERLKEYEEMEE